MQRQFEIISERLTKIEKALHITREAEYMDADEFCQLTNMSKNTFYQNRKDIAITPYYFGRKLRFKRSEAMQWYYNNISNQPSTISAK